MADSTAAGIPDDAFGVALEAGELHRAAEDATGLADWGSDDSYLAGLDALIRSADRSALSDEGRRQLREQLLGVLSTRLRLVEDERRSPEVLELDVGAPIILIGLARTGTTILLELISLDPALRAPLEWEVGAPWPAPEVATFQTDPRIARRQQAIDRLLATAHGERRCQLTVWHSWRCTSRRRATGRSTA